MYELHYGTGGQGDPHDTIEAAVTQATALLRSSAVEQIITVQSVDGPVVAAVEKGLRAFSGDPDVIIVTYYTTPGEVIE